MIKSVKSKPAVGRGRGAKPGVKKPNPIDEYVGGRIRLRRMMLGMSQEKLGNQLDVTFQQVQKYEKGANRVGASRLFAVSQILGVPVQFFFEDAPSIRKKRGRKAAGFAENKSETFILEFINSREGLQLNRSFVKIADHNVRKRVVDLVKSLAEGRSKL